MTKLNSIEKLILLPRFDNAEIMVFSPHLDDAVLSLGSLMYRMIIQNIKLSVISIFTEGSEISSPLTNKLLDQAKFTNANSYFQARREEDVRALLTLGTVTTSHLGYIDAPWRGVDNHALYPETTLQLFREQDKQLVSKLSTSFKNIFHHTNDQLIFAPLALGRHVDHIITRTVCREVFPNIIYYCDFPYSNYSKNEDEFIQENNLQPFVWQADNKKKTEAIFTYSTQRQSIFPNNHLKLLEEKFYSLAKS